MRKKILISLIFLFLFWLSPAKADDYGFYVVKNFIENGATADLVSDGSKLYGILTSAGIYEKGQLYKVDLNGANYETLKTFGLNSTDAKLPNRQLLLSGSTIYGVSSEGGDYNQGTIFSISKTGADFTILHSFDRDLDGSSSNNLLLKDNFLYGVNAFGANENVGCIWKLSLSTLIFTKLRYFTGNEDGGIAQGTIATDQQYIYGSTISGGANNYGTIFSYEIGSDNTFTILHDFISPISAANLIYANSKIYGATAYGGDYNAGSLFSMTIAGEYSTLYSFTGNEDGSIPYGAPYYYNGKLYGTTADGKIYSYTLATSVFSVLHSAGYDDGAEIQAGLILIGNSLYGVASSGGTNSNGTLFTLHNYSNQSIILPAAPTTLNTLSGTIINIGTSTASNVFSTYWPYALAGGLLSLLTWFAGKAILFAL